MKRLIDFALNSRFMVIALALLLLVWGAISFHNLPVEDGQFKRVAVVGGKMLPDNLQEVTGIDPGQKVVQNALALQATVEQVAQ